MGTDFKAEWWWRREPYCRKNWPGSEYFRKYEQELAFAYELARRIDPATTTEKKVTSWPKTPNRVDQQFLPRHKFPPWDKLPQDLREKIAWYTMLDHPHVKSGKSPWVPPFYIKSLNDGEGIPKGFAARISGRPSDCAIVRVDLLTSDKSHLAGFKRWLVEQRKTKGIPTPVKNKGAKGRKPRWTYLEALDSNSSGNSSITSTRSKARRWKVDSNLLLIMKLFVGDWLDAEATALTPTETTTDLPDATRQKRKARPRRVSPKPMEKKRAIKKPGRLSKISRQKSTA